MSRKGVTASSELQWQIDERTIRDCPGNRTELEWKVAVGQLEERLQGHDKTCPTCGQSIQASHKYNVTETEEWLPSKSDLPRGRWALHAHTPTLRAARILQRFMGPRATVWVRTEIEGNSSSYKKVDGDKS
jgi:DNA repair exonuclease SbcCD ATPase subunit